MGSRGPAPKARAGLKFAEGVPPAPAWMTEEAVEHYDWFALQLSTAKGHLQVVDMGALAMMAQTYADMVKQQLECKDIPATTTGAKGGSYTHPAHTHLITLRNQYLTLLGKLGATPADRQRLNAMPIEPDNSTGLGGFLSGRNRPTPPPAPAKKKTVQKKSAVKKSPVKKTVKKKTVAVKKKPATKRKKTK